LVRGLHSSESQRNPGSSIAGSCWNKKRRGVQLCLPSLHGPEAARLKGSSPARQTDVGARGEAQNELETSLKRARNYLETMEQLRCYFGGTTASVFLKPSSQPLISCRVRIKTRDPTGGTPNLDT